MRSHPSQRCTSKYASIAGESTQHEIEQRLKTSSYHVLRRVRCSCDDGRVILYGRVNSYYLKQLAQVLAQQVAGVTGIDNRLDVVVDAPTVWLEIEEAETGPTCVCRDERKPRAGLSAAVGALA